MEIRREKEANSVGDVGGRRGRGKTCAKSQEPREERPDKSWANGMPVAWVRCAD